MYRLIRALCVIRHRLRLVLAWLLLPASLSGQVCSPSDTRVDPGLGSVFSAHDVNGTVVLLDMSRQTCVRFNPERAGERFLPASTFKIFNTMVALDEGSIPDAETVLKWDGVDRGLPAWNRDQNMREAFRSSTVWFYQELAKRTGEADMREWLEREQYGNADASGGIDRFWMDGGLRISADEQVAFLWKLHRRELSFSAPAQQMVYDLLLWEQTAEHTIRGKTGWTEEDGRQLGWFVGYVEKGNDVYIYALNFDSTDPEFPMRVAREKILRQILGRLGLVSPGVT
jgi:beta-lactamase class D